MNIKQEYIRCYQDKTRIYFIENYLSTFNAMERKEVPFKLFPRQKVFLESCAKYNNTIAIKYRQSGVSTMSAAFIAGQCVFANRKSPEIALCIANKLDQAIELSNKIVNFLDQVPRWMWGADFYSADTDSEKNKKSIYIKRNKGYIELFNGCKIYSRASTPHAARGISAVSILVFDEAAYIENSMASYTAAVAAQSTVSNPKCIMVSTPNGKDQLYYKTYIQALKGENNYHPVEFKWFQDPRYNRNLKWYKKDEKSGETQWKSDTVIDKKGNVKYDEQRWADLEKDGWTPTSPWFENMCKSFNNDSQKIAQELLVSFLGSADNVVPIEVIEQQSKQNVIKITDDWNLRDLGVKETWIWKDPIPNHRYICSCLPTGEKVLTQDGLKNVEDVTLKDKLYDKDGNLTSIIKKYERYIEEEVYEIKLYNNLKSVIYTGNHPLFSSIKSVLKRDYPRINGKVINGDRYWEHSFCYNKAINIKSGDWLIFPNVYRKYILTDREILSHWEYDKIDNPLLKEDFWWYCGMWLAEGCCVINKEEHFRIYTSHFIKETSIHERVFNVIGNILKHKPQKRILYNCKNCVNIFYNFDYLAKFLNKTFGKYAHGKFISEWVKMLPTNLKLNLLLGYFEGDGSFVDNKRDGRIIKAGSVSSILLNDLQDILYSIGIISTVHKNKAPTKRTIRGKQINCRQSYELSIGKFYSQELFKMWNITSYEDNRQRKHPKNYIYFSEKLDFIYCRIESIITKHYKGIVYNFETETHNYMTNRMIVHNCDPSSGSGEDSTAIEVIDVDAVDDKGCPFFEQVLEYNGKVNGEDAAELINKYGSVYNDALAVVESIGGYGDTIVLSLRDRFHYPNLYYDETSALKNYTTDYAKKLFKLKDNDKLPGFRSNGLRLQMISNFVEMLKNNSFRVRSERVISELDTWVFKNGRPDHMDGCHDDLLTCLSMGLFVMQYYMLKTDKLKQKDKQIVGSWFVNNSSNTNLQTRHLGNEVNMTDRKEMSRKFNPFMSDYKQKNEEDRFLKGCIMLGGFGIKK